MSTLYSRNILPSSIIISGYNVYSVDSSNIETVDVQNDTLEKYRSFKYVVNNTSYYYVVDGIHNVWVNDLSSIGYSEVPSIVLPTVTFSDDISSGTISSLTLPTTHSGYYTDAKFDSLRYYVKGTVSDSQYVYGLYGHAAGWYGGVITWFDSSVGDLSDKIFTTGAPDASTSTVKQTILRVHLITNGSIGGYSVWDTIYDSVVGQISNYTYNNGQHSITLWFNNIGGDWTTFDGAGRLMLRYLDGTTAFNNLDSFNLFNVSSGTLSKATTTDRYDMYNVWNDSVTLNARYASCSEQGVTTVTVYNSSNVTYNAFKFTANNTDYYYVLDGTQTDWTEDLALIGYSLTPAVVKDGYTLYGTSDIRSITIASGETHDLYEFGEGKKSFDTSKSYATYRWQQGSAYTRDNVTNLQIVNNSGYFAVKNISSDAITNFICIVIAVCSSNQAVVITVYNSSSVAYNAFKYTTGGTDYYYILDGTQEDWTDDLVSIGYLLPWIDVDVNYGDPVTIPNGYTVASVKSTRAYMFKDYASYSFNDVLLASPVGTKDLYCNDTDINLIKQGVAPCLQIFQITEIQSQGSYKGFYLSSRTSQTVSVTFNIYEDSVLNSTYSGSVYFLRYRASSSSSTASANIANSTYPLQFRRYNSQDVLIGYYFSVPQTLWKFQNGTFSWLGDSTNWSDLSYYYKGTAIRIHCVL